MQTLNPIILFSSVEILFLLFCAKQCKVTFILFAIQQYITYLLVATSALHISFGGCLLAIFFDTIIFSIVRCVVYRHQNHQLNSAAFPIGIPVGILNSDFCVAMVKVLDFQKKIDVIYRPKQICRFTILNLSFEFTCVFYFNVAFCQVCLYLVRNGKQQVLH